MAEKKIQTRFILRNDTSENWQTANPILLKGEIGVAIDLNKIKIGDGITEWNKLKYSGASIEDLPRDTYYEIIDETGKGNDLELLNTITLPKQGDISVIKKYITTDSNGDKKYTCTGYMYDNEKWGAMDGNYSADNVYLSGSFVVTAPMGVITQEKINEGNGSVELSVEGKNINQFLSSLMAEEIDPEVDYPTATFTTSNQSGEVGTAYNLPTATFKVSDMGSYTYGSKDGNNVEYIPDDTGVIFDIGDIVLTQGSQIKSNESILNKANDSFSITATTSGDTLFTDESIKYTFSVVAEYTESDRVPINNIKNKVDNLKISTDTLTLEDCTATITGWRKMFMGSVDEYDEESGKKTEVELNSATIRGLSLISKQVSNTAQTFTVPVGATKIIIAFPEDYTTKTPKFEYFTMSWEGFSGFVKHTSAIPVADARGGTNGEKNYTVYTFTHANPSGFEANTQFRVTLSK